LHCAHVPYFCTKSGQTTERISIQHNVEKNSLTWNSWFHEIFVKNCESKIPYIISTLTQFFFSSLSWSRVAFFHKRYKIPFDNCTNSTFFSTFFSKQQVKYLLSSRAFWRKKCLLLEINGDVLSSKRKNDLLYCFYFWFKKVIRNHRIFDFGHCYQALGCFRNYFFSWNWFFICGGQIFCSEF